MRRSICRAISDSLVIKLDFYLVGKLTYVRMPVPWMHLREMAQVWFVVKSRAIRDSLVMIRALHGYCKNNESLQRSFVTVAMIVGDNLLITFMNMERDRSSTVFLHPSKLNEFKVDRARAISPVVIRFSYRRRKRHNKFHGTAVRLWVMLRPRFLDAGLRAFL